MADPLTPGALQSRMRLIRVDEVTLWPGNPNEADVGAIHASLGEFGQLETILVCDGVVYSGNHRVIAERQTGRFGGELLAVDVTGLGWSRERLTAAGLALNRIGRLGRFVDDVLVERLVEVAQADDVDLDVTGFDADDLDQLIRDAERAASSPPGTAPPAWRVCAGCTGAAERDRAINALEDVGLTAEVAPV